MIHFRIAWLQIGWAEVMNLCADPILCQKCFQLVSFPGKEREDVENIFMSRRDEFRSDASVLDIVIQMFQV